MPIASSSSLCAWALPAPGARCAALRSRQTADAATKTKMPKKSPVISSQSTPESRAVGSQTARLKRRPPSTRPRRLPLPAEELAPARDGTGACDRSRSGALTVVGLSGPDKRAAADLCGARPASAPERLGADDWAAVAGRASADDRGPVFGCGAVAASTAPTSVFAACRAPIPRTRPSRSVSIALKSMRVQRLHSNQGRNSSCHDAARLHPASQSGSSAVCHERSRRLIDSMRHSITREKVET